MAELPVNTPTAATTTSEKDKNGESVRRILYHIDAMLDRHHQ